MIPPREETCDESDGQLARGINVNAVAALIGVAALIFAYTSLNNTIRAEMGSVRVEVSSVRVEVNDLQGDVADLRKEVADLRVEVADLRTEMVAMEGRLTNSFEERFDAIEREQIRLQSAFDALPR